MKKRIWIAPAVVSLLLFTAVSCGQQGPNMKEGLWEITVKMDMPGMPMQMPPQTYTHCLTHKDMVPQKKEEPGQSCKEIKREVKGDTVSWVVECPSPEGVVTSSGTVSYKGDAMDGVVKVRVPGGKQGGMEMTQHLKGRWIGQCK